MTQVSDPIDRTKLGAVSANGLAITMGAQFLRLGIQLGYQIFLARLLLPADFGVVAMAAPILAFVALFADFGLTQATVQRPSITQGELSFIFWINVAFGIALWLITLAAGPLVGWFYKSPEVSSITMALGILFLCGGLFTQQLALLNRRFAFGKLALVDIVSLGLGAAAGITAAKEGAGFWAIVIGQATTSLASIPLAWLCTGWIPDKPSWTADARALLGFGANITIYNIVNYFARNLDNVLIGRFSGASALGLYDRAYKLLLLPLSQVSTPFTKIAMPLLGRTLNEPEVYRRAYLRMLEMIMLLTYPGIIFAICTSRQLVAFALGEKWAGVAPIFAVLGLGALFAPISNSTGWLFITQNRTKEMRNWGMVSSALFVASFVAGLPWGPLGVAISYISVGTFQGPLIWWAATRTGPVSFSRLGGALYPYAFGALATAVAELGLARVLPEGPLALIPLFIVAYATFVGMLACLPRGRAVLGETRTEARRIIAKLRGPRPAI